MKAVDYFKIKGRMTDNCDMNCGKCLLYAMNNGRGAFCGKYEVLNPKEAIEIVSKWAKEHPVKTYLSVLLERLPNIQFECDGTPNFCPDDVFKIKLKPSACDEIDCIDCWNREYKEDADV
jgi:hypothetical protein